MNVATCFRSQHQAHARITRLDVSSGAARTGCIGVFTADDLFPVLVNPYWGGWEGTATADDPPLARNKVRWVGEPIVAILAASRYMAEDIAELVEVYYEPLPAVADADEAFEPDSAPYTRTGTPTPTSTTTSVRRPTVIAAPTT